MNENRNKAAEFLREYRILRENEEIIREQMFSTERTIISLEKSNSCMPPNNGNDTRYKEFIRQMTEKKVELNERLLFINLRKDMIRAMVSKLSGNEKEVIEGFFIIGDGSRAADRLMEQLDFEKSQIYRLKDRGLDRIYSMMQSCFSNDMNKYELQ